MFRLGKAFLILMKAPWGDELIDACTKLPLPKSKGLKRPGRAFRFPVHLSGPLQSISTPTYCPFLNSKKKAKEVGVTINEYLTAAFLYMALQVQLKNKPRKLLPVRVSVPCQYAPLLRIKYFTELLNLCHSRNKSAFH